MREELLLAEALSDKVLSEIHQQKYLQIWVPKIYGGRELSFVDGLQLLQSLAFIDGSFGWTVTLCSGAHYFARNLLPTKAKELFSSPDIFVGGSGMVGGTAEKTSSGFILNGRWMHATGASYLSHFTLNAQITENGQPCLGDNQQPIVRSFIVPKERVSLHPSWPFMGMRATHTYAFEVKNAAISREDSFVYDEFYTQDLISHLPFRLFADATLMVNYLGMATHFAEEATNYKSDQEIQLLKDFVDQTSEKLLNYAQQSERILMDKNTILVEFIEEVHRFCTNALHHLTHLMLDVYLILGMKASKNDELLHQIFRDFFTATQHANFRK
ncbi:hypothetical protein HMPREF2660_04530 [Weeksella sp. HMSC059D05]|nr:hypothetical protein [Weeksella virosa]OFM82340.1 hypothetical protein HMPREF2660_04530 [Weeksella sp. HMSC059D05]